MASMVFSRSNEVPCASQCCDRCGILHPYIYSAQIHVFLGVVEVLVCVGLGEVAASEHDVISILYLNESSIKIQLPWGGLVQAEEISARKCSNKCDGRQPLFEEEPTVLLIISHKKRQHQCRCRSVR